MAKPTTPLLFARVTITKRILTTVILILFTSPIINAGNNHNPIIQFRDTNYSPSSTTNVTYISSQSYDAKGMAPLYKIANQILSLFIGNNILPDGYIIVSEGNIKPGTRVENNDWGPLLQQYWAILLVITICALIIVLMPIIAFCFCCCRCAGGCGGRSQPFDKKHDTCRRVMLGLLLILAATGLVFGVVVAFVTNNYLHQGVQNATTSAREGVDDSQKFLKSTSFQVNHLLVTNYEELSGNLNVMLNETSSVVVEKLEEESKAISLIQLATFVDSLPKMQTNLNRMKEITNGLRVNASQLSDGLRSVKRVLLETLSKCSTVECTNVLKEYEIGNLDINGLDYDKLPDVSTTIDSIKELLSAENMKPIIDGQSALENMKNDLEKSIKENIPKVTDSIQEAGSALRKISKDISRIFDQLSNTIGNNSYKYFDTADYYIANYINYSCYSGIFISSLLLFILLCIVLGLFCGICGKRPDGYGDDCCNKGSGSRFLMISVSVIFLTISLLTAIALIIFLSGLILRRGVCMPLQDPANDNAFWYIDQYIDLNKIFYTQESDRRLFNKMEPFRISEVIVACHQNKSIYKVLHLNNYFNIEEIKEYPAKFGIDDVLKELIHSIELEKDIIILTPEAKLAIKQLKESELNDFAAYKFVDNLNETVTRYDLNAIAKKLTETADKIPPSSGEMSEVRASLNNQALHLKTYQDNLVEPMTKQTKEMIMLANSLEKMLLFNRSSFEEAMNAFEKEIEIAQNFINNNGTTFVKEVAQELVTKFHDEITNYLDLVVIKTENDLGKCGPLSNVYDSLTVAGCNRVVDPFNGFWAGVAWCVLIFLPTIILSVKLSTLYQKSDPYPGPLVDAEYMYDAYSERDNIPLANGPKNKRKKKNERRRSSRDRRGDYYEDTSSPHGPSSASTGPRDARYNDMAPNSNGYRMAHNNINNNNINYGDDHLFTIYPPPGRYRPSNDIPRHWDNGPPRYQNPPMAPPASEYERPPPYYFPGAPSEPE